MANHVVLVGLMGSGKTTAGRRVAARLDREFIDADQAVEEITDRTIADIFAADGEVGFRAIETDVLEELLEHHRPAVIATGGGVVLSEANRRLLRDESVTVVWLDGSPAFLASRLEGKPGRPLLAGDEPAVDVLTRLHAERASLYADVADIVVDIQPPARGGDHPKEHVAERVAELVLAHEAASAQEPSR